MSRGVVKESKPDLYEAILELQDLEECRQFFEDICAMTELQSMEQRYEVARMLLHDKVYTEIKTQTNASTATISRVNRMLNTGTGCVEKIVARVEEKERKQ